MIARREDLGLHHEMLLLALHDRQGTTHTYGTYAYALGAAVLGALLQGGHAAIVTERRKLLIEARGRRPAHDEVLAEAWDRIATAGRRAQIEAWVRRFAGLKQLKHRVAHELCRRGVLRAEERTILLIFRRTIYPEIDPRPERAMLQRLRRLIFADHRRAGDQRDLTLLSLADSVGLLPVLFGKREVKPQRARLKELVGGEPLGRAVRRLCESDHTAVMGGVVAATGAT